MRVLQVAPPWFEVPPRRYGGIELVVSALTEELVARGHDVTLLAAGGSRTAARLVPTTSIPAEVVRGEPVTELLHVTTIDDLAAFDVVHDHTLTGAVVADARGAAPVVHTLHGRRSPQLELLLRRLGRSVALVAISRDQARSFPSVPLRAVVPNGLDPEGYPLPTEPRGEELLFLGRAARDKGPDLAIEVARRTGRRLVMAVKIEEPEERAYWRDVVEPRLGDADVRVVRDADHATKVGLLRHAHAVVLPLRWPEPFGMVMIEAAACGTPVVVFDRGAASEIVRDGVTGHLVPAADGVEGLVRAVGRAGEVDPDTCRAVAVARFSAAAMTDRYLAVYDAAIERWATRTGIADTPASGGRSAAWTHDEELHRGPHPDAHLRDRRRVRPIDA
jgi:glycosyltransferase involved in cell wall biosynthesis